MQKILKYKIIKYILFKEKKSHGELSLELLKHLLITLQKETLNLRPGPGYWK